ncbi:hypothetical protein KC614_03245 [candidate division WWE3 bacterium]|uniref:Uncharacterized protein n=1 Tax=candidate division WWE3 bacterium TaxID=2053526 RepID=A0A955LKU9_UNCKA|nr:hypothetical protein [candidate division WWE3 bacterium]
MDDILVEFENESEPVTSGEDDAEGMGLGEDGSGDNIGMDDSGPEYTYPTADEADKDQTVEDILEETPDLSEEPGGYSETGGVE